VAAADVFDALTSDRVYRPAFPVEEAKKMMREQRGRHFDPVLLDAFMDILERNGPDARELPSDPEALVEDTLETFVSALGRGEAETAEEAIAAAIDAGITPTTLHAEVIGPSLRRISVQASSGEIDSDREQLALSIIRRVLATLSRYMTAAAQPTRQRVLLASVEGDTHMLGLQMVSDQLAAAGFRRLRHGSPSRAAAQVESRALMWSWWARCCPPWRVRWRSPCAICAPSIRRSRSCPAARRRRALPPSSRASTLERIDKSVPAVEDVLASTAPGA
jgi:hypothetical protein